MKRAAAAFVLVAGLGGCMTATPGTKQPPPTNTPAPAEPRGMTPAGSRGKMDGGVIHAAALGVDRVTTDPNVRQANGFGAKLDPQTYGPTQSGLGMTFGHGGILPAPGMGPWGAVALVPGAATGPGGGAGGLYSNGRSSIKFVSTPSTSKMKIGFQDAARGWVDSLVVPQSYAFAQGNIYRLRLSGIPNRPEAVYYPTLEVYPATRETVTFLSHADVPVGFTDEDFDQVKAGNMVVKVIYLPSAQFQDVAAAEEIVSTRLEPGANAVDEAARRGTILAVIRLGNIDLEDPTTPAMDAPAGGMGPGGPPPRTGPGMPPPPPGPMPAPKGEEPPPAKSAKVPASLPSISLPPVK